MVSDKDGIMMIAILASLPLCNSQLIKRIPLFYPSETRAQPSPTMTPAQNLTTISFVYPSVCRVDPSSSGVSRGPHKWWYTPGIGSGGWCSSRRPTHFETLVF
jgi:hypothetical protein